MAVATAAPCGAVVEAAMIVGITTWDELPACDGHVLLVVNSDPADTQAVEAAFDALTRYAGAEAVHVVADPSWAAWLAARGLPDDRVRFATDDHGRPLELNHFLESPDAALWIVPRQFRAIAGSSAHNLYNEEVKEIFERQVCLLLGDGRFIAHTLPQRYLAVFDLAALVGRFGRRDKTDQYRDRCRSFVQDCQAAWVRHGSPPPTDTQAPELLELIGAHFGREIFGFDEEGASAFCHGQAAKDLEALGLRYRTVLHRHDEMLTARYRERAEAAESLEAWVETLQAERTEAVAVRDRLLADQQAARDALLAELQAERNGAVGTRDRMLADLQAERDQAIAIRDSLVADLQAERNQAIAVRDGLAADLDAAREQAIATRNDMLADREAEHARAVGERDRIIAGLKSDVQFLTHGWRRWVVKRRG